MHFTFTDLMPIIVLMHNLNSGMAFELLSPTGIVRGGDSGLRFAAAHRADRDAIHSSSV
jgi:hypothetical protein